MVFQFEIIINVLLSYFCFIWIPILWFYGHYKYVTLLVRGLTLDVNRCKGYTAKPFLNRFITPLKHCYCEQNVCLNINIWFQIQKIWVIGTGPLEVVDRGSKKQLQVDANLIDLI